MMATSSLKITTPRNREIAMTRVFDAPRKLVYQAHTKPELVQRWLLGSDGWSMPVCTIDLRVGGAYRYVWHRDRDGHEMGMGASTARSFRTSASSLPKTSMMRGIRAMPSPRQPLPKRPARRR